VAGSHCDRDTCFADFLGFWPPAAISYFIWPADSGLRTPDPSPPFVTTAIRDMD
jgi:hypothetical protein